MKLAIVVQRYGQSINGGAELHARYVAERLARHVEVEVLTTCAADYVSWRNELPAGIESVNGISVRRFPVKHERDPLDFGRRSDRVFQRQHSIADELEWLDAEGPHSPRLLGHLTKHAHEYDFVIIFSYRYHQAFHAVRAVPSKAILVPTAERDATMGLSIFPPIFRGARALMYNSPEERAMIQSVAGNEAVPSVVVGVGSEVPSSVQPQRFRQKFDIRGPFAVYVGRIDENKGCKELFDFFLTYVNEGQGRLSLVLIGNSILPVPTHPRIRHLGFLDDQDKFDAIAASELLVMPSYFESLSMVALEAWALGRPVVVNGKCDVLRGQVVRSSAGLYYENRQEFVETLRALERTRWLNASLGKSGRQFYRDHYDWPVIERKYLDMIDRLAKAGSTSTLEGLPDWIHRRRADCRPARDVMATVPVGPVLTAEPFTSRPDPVVSSDAGTDPTPLPAPTPARHWTAAPSHPPHRRGPHRGRPRSNQPRGRA